MSFLFAPLLLFLSGVSSAPVEIEEYAGARISLPPGFTKTLFEDDFSTQQAGALPSAEKWTLDIGTSYPGGAAQWGTNEIQTYTNSPDNIAITADGTLKITPLLAGGQWTSARIETTTANDFSCAPGTRIRMEASLKLGSGAAASQMGIWPAFWSLGSAYRGNYQNWPAVGEIDIMESLNGLPTAWHTIHCGTPSAGPCSETNGIGGTATMTRGEWHTVAVEIDRTNAGGDWAGESLKWFVDGTNTLSVTGSRVGDLQAWTALARAPKFLLLNVALGGSFADAIARAKTPNGQTVGGDGSAMEIGHVAVFST